MIKARKLYYTEKELPEKRFILKEYDEHFADDFSNTVKQLDDGKTFYLYYCKLKDTEVVPYFNISDGGTFMRDELLELFNINDIDIYLKEYETHDEAYDESLKLK